MFESNAFLFDLPTTEYHKRVPIPIDTSITDLAINSLDL